jgi:hypothetical protein
LDADIKGEHTAHALSDKMTFPVGRQMILSKISNKNNKGGQNMFIFTCSRDALIEIGSVKVRVASVNQESVDLEIDTPGDTFLEPGESSYEESQRDSSLEYLEITRP